mgnify:CR=1 FL=1
MLIILSVVLYNFGKKHFSKMTGIAMSLGISANMLFHTNSVVVTPDVPLAFFSIMAIVYYFKAYFIHERYFYIGGIFLGVAILSKVSALFTALGIILFPIVNSRKRHFLINVRFYASLIIALILFMPFIIWNLQNDLAFVRYQGAHIMERGDWSDFTSLWAGLFLTAGPILFYYSVIKPFFFIKRMKSIKVEIQYFIFVTIIPLCYFLFHSFFSHMEVNWPAPIFYGGIFLFGISVGKSWPVLRKQFLFQVIFSVVLIMTITIQTFFPFLPIKGKTDVKCLAYFPEYCRCSKHFISFPYLKMQLWTKYVSGTSNAGNCLPFFHLITPAHSQDFVMCICGNPSVTMFYQQQIAKAAQFVSRISHNTRAR